MGPLKQLAPREGLELLGGTGGDIRGTQSLRRRCGVTQGSDLENIVDSGSRQAILSLDLNSWIPRPEAVRGNFLFGTLASACSAAGPG
jgi:hypothetical protein